jgi:hypothetical protein
VASLLQTPKQAAQYTPEQLNEENQDNGAKIQPTYGWDNALDRVEKRIDQLVYCLADWMERRHKIRHEYLNDNDNSYKLNEPLNESKNNAHMNSLH